jgi:micrococcal nuclease
MSKKTVTLLSALILFAYQYYSSTLSQSTILGTQTVAVTPTITLIQPLPTPLSGTMLVKKIVDGDTIKIMDGTSSKTIRLIGVDTPETVDPRKTIQCFGNEASLFTKSLVEGQLVTVQSDETQELTDKYGRTLAYVYLSDGTLVNEKIIRSGYGYEYTYDVPYRYQKEFKEAQAQAEAEGRGLWNTSTCQGKR